jgi:hypothetical protein
MVGAASTCFFASTLEKMGLDISKMLTPSKAPFYGIVPSNAATPLGSVVLLVTFGTKDNYRTEYIKFEVADFDSSYHAILGRPARLVVPCHPWQTGIGQIHGRAPLRLLATQDARQDRLPHTPWQPEEVVRLRLGGD